jgi:peptide chain release factor 1
MALEHTKLSEELAKDFNSKTAKRIGELSAVTNVMKRWDKVNNVGHRIQRVRLNLANIVWQSLKELNALLSEPTTDPELRELASEDLASTSSELESLSKALTISLVPPHPFANLPCLIEVRPGVGGSEAGLFAGELLRMYQSFCSQHKLKCSLLKYEDSSGMTEGSSTSQVQEAILEIDTEGSYDLFRTEAGVHRVQRVPATENKGSWGFLHPFIVYHASDSLGFGHKKPSNSADRIQSYQGVRTHRLYQS